MASLVRRGAHLTAKRSLIALIAILLAVLHASSAHAAAGDLDSGFGHDGKVNTDFPGSYDVATGIAVLPDQRVVVVGYSEFQLAVARYGHRGLDRTFGTRGRVLTSFGYQIARANDVATEPDGKILAVGEAGSFANSDVAVARFRPNGEIDPTFGQHGIVTSELGGDSDVAEAVTLDSGGKIVVAGSTDSGGTYDDFALERFNPDGSLDPTFGGDGKVVISLSSTHDVAYAVAVQPDGKVIAAGSAQVNLGEVVAMARFEADGSLDPTFGSGGIVLSDLGPYREAVYGMALQPDGTIVVTGLYSQPARLVARFRSDGTLDPAFGSGGVAVIAYPFVSGRDLVIQPDGRIITVGRVQDETNGFGISRQNPDGSLDPSFGDDGLVSTRFGSYADPTSVAILRHGLILAAGSSPLPNNERFVLARYLG